MLNILLEDLLLLEELGLPCISLLFLLFKHATESLDLNFCKSSELDLFLLILEGGVRDKLRMVHLQNFQFLMCSGKFGLELLALKRLDFLYFIDLLTVNLVQSRCGFGLCLLNLVVKLLNLILMSILHLFLVLFQLGDLCFKTLNL